MSILSKLTHGMEFNWGSSYILFLFTVTQIVVILCLYLVSLLMVWSLTGDRPTQIQILKTMLIQRKGKGFVLLLTEQQRIYVLILE